MSRRESINKEQRVWLVLIVSPMVFMVLCFLALWFIFVSLKEVNDYRFPPNAAEVNTRSNN